MITEPRRSRINEVFEHALSLPVAERESYIQSSGDRQLVEEVRSRFRIGKYTITEVIGEGGMGRVFGAFDTRDQRSVAIKVLINPDAPEMVTRFRTEADLMSSLKHPCIVAGLESGVVDGSPYLVMERLSGRTLADLIGKNALTLLEKVEAMSQVAAGVQYLHGRGVIHRDIKPANIMRLPDGAVKIMDFGISRVASTAASGVQQWHTKTGFLVGSPTYMAPELFYGEKANACSEIFAYGVIFYELLTGINPCKVSNIDGIEYPAPYSVPQAAYELVPWCPESLSMLVSKALSEKAADRYQSIDALIADLKPALSELRRERADDLSGEAVQLYWNGQVDQADAVARRVLALDPTHEGAGRLCARVDEIRRLEKLLDDRLFEDAQTLLRSIPQGQRDEPPRASRFQAVEARLEKYRRNNQLMVSARQNLDNGNLEGANEASTRVLADDPSHTLARRLSDEIRQRIAAREAERFAARQLQDRIASLKHAALSSIGASDFDQAILSLSALLEASPNEPDLTDLLKAAVAGKARQLQTSLHSGPVASASIKKRTFAFLDKRSLPFIVPFAVAAVVLTILFFVTRPAPKPPPERLEPLAVEASSASTSGTVGQPASTRLRASGGSPPYAWTIAAGGLPPGIRLDPGTGALTGSFTQAGSFSFTVRSSDRAGRTAQQQGSISVSQAQAVVKPPAPVPVPVPQQSQHFIPVIPPEPPCKAVPFSLKQYGDRQSGQLIWSIPLKGGGQAGIPAEPGSSVGGALIPLGVPVRLSVSPATIEFVSKPSVENCWESPVRVRNIGPDVRQIVIDWKVFQPQP